MGLGRIGSDSKFGKDPSRARINKGEGLSSGCDSGRGKGIEGSAFPNRGGADNGGSPSVTTGGPGEERFNLAMDSYRSAGIVRSDKELGTGPTIEPGTQSG